MQQINTHQMDNGLAFSTEARGVEYFARVDGMGRWEVSSRRLALGRSNVGTVRHFDTLEAVEASVKAFDGLALLLQPAAVVH